MEIENKIVTVILDNIDVERLKLLSELAGQRIDIARQNNDQYLSGMSIDKLRVVYDKISCNIDAL